LQIRTFSLSVNCLQLLIVMTDLYFVNRTHEAIFIEFRLIIAFLVQIVPPAVSLPRSPQHLRIMSRRDTRILSPSKSVKNGTLRSPNSPSRKSTRQPTPKSSKPKRVPAQPPTPTVPTPKRKATPAEKPSQKPALNRKLSDGDYDDAEASFNEADYEMETEQSDDPPIDDDVGFPRAKRPKLVAQAPQPSTQFASTPVASTPAQKDLRTRPEKVALKFAGGTLLLSVFFNIRDL
jgi:hypothetical protein